MNRHPFLAAIYAAARRHLAKARTEQELALEASLRQYDAGQVGARARESWDRHDAAREAAIQFALDCRRKASRLRTELRRLESDDTQPPRLAS